MSVNMNKKNSVFIVILFFLPTLNYAAQWAVDANIHQEMGYNDNVRMAQEPKGSMWYKVNPGINFTHTTDNSQIVGSASYGIQRYSAFSTLNKILQSYSLDANYQTERTTWSLGTSMSIAPSINSASTDSGNFSSNSEVTRTTISPSFSYKLTELDSLQFAGSYSQKTFTGTDFRNSESQSIHLDWQRQWTERLSNSLSLSYSEFSSTIQKSGSYNLNIGTNYSLSEKWAFVASGGARLTNFEINSDLGVIKSQSQGYLLNVELNYTGEKLSSQLGFNRSLMPSNQGLLQEQDKFNINVNYPLSSQLSTSVNASYMNSKKTMASNEDISRKFISIQSMLNWKLSPDWAITANYTYRNKSTASQMGNGTSNSFVLSINYNWPGLSLSR